MKNSGNIEIKLGPVVKPEIRSLKGPSDEPTVVEYKYPDGERFVRRVITPERKNPLPIFVFWDETVKPDQQKVIIKSIQKLLDFVGLNRDLLCIYGNWRENDHRLPDRSLRPHASIEWQIKSKLDRQRKQVMADQIIDEMLNDPHQLQSPHWEIVFTNRDMATAHTNFVIGGARADLGTVISLGRLSRVKDRELREECIKTEIYHEVGHVFGLPNTNRGRNLEYSLGPHCTNKGCSMKQGLRVPHDWVVFTKERLRVGGRPYCHDCAEGLRVKYGG